MAQQNTTKIIRSVNSSKYNFTPISNSLIQNQTLSLEARGLVIFILSLPETWVIYKGQVQTALNMNKTKFNRVWKECIDAGYIKVIKERVDNGSEFEVFKKVSSIDSIIFCEVPLKISLYLTKDLYIPVDGPCIFQ